jgi:hypothetical protein
MPECLFCERAAGSTEHVFPQWILDRKDMGFSQLQVGNRAERILKDTHLTVKTVCDSSIPAG